MSTPFTSTSSAAPIPSKSARVTALDAKSGVVRPLIRSCVAGLIRVLLRVDVDCPPDVAAALKDGGVLVTANHVSLVDGPLVALTSPVPLLFAVDTDYSRRSAAARRGMDGLARLGCGEVLPLDSGAPFGIRRLVKDLRAGSNVMVFPEGEIAAGAALPAKQGLAWMLERCAPRRVHIRITGAERSRLFAKRGTEWLPRIHLEYSLDA